MKVCAPSSSSSASKTPSLQAHAAAAQLLMPPSPRITTLARQLAWSCYVAHTDKYSYDGGLENPQLQACMRHTTFYSRQVPFDELTFAVPFRGTKGYNEPLSVRPSMHSWYW